MSEHREKYKDNYDYPNSVVYELNDKVEKLQERIKELEAEIVVVKSQKMREFMSGSDAELAKRDQLISDMEKELEVLREK